MARSIPTGTVTFVFTDIVGSSERWQRHGAEMADAVARHDRMVLAAVADNGGHVFARGGDGFGAAFSSASAALHAAAAIQRAVRAEDWSSVGGLSVRIGVDTGTAEERDGNYFGPVVNRCSRIADLAHGGQVLVCETTMTLSSGLEDGLAVEDLGEHELRSFSRPQRLGQLVGTDLDHSFPPLEKRPSGNLPAQITSFVGRSEDVEVIGQLLSGGRLVTVTGAGGVGKTRLALEVARRAATPAWLVELAATRDAALVDQAIAGALGIRLGDATPVPDQVDRFLAERRLLLVLDNCEHLTDAVAVVVARIVASAPEVRVLATSRELLGLPGEREHRLRPLPVTGRDSDAARLFLDRATDGQPPPASWDEPVEQLCHRLDGLPLALEIAAAHARILHPREILSHLDERLTHLEAGPASTRRHRTLRATLDWSIQLLTHSERQLLERLAVFVDGFTVASAESVAVAAGVDPADVTTTLLALHRKSLVERDRHGDSTRFSMLETIREHGSEQLQRSGELDAVRDVHVDEVLRLVEPDSGDRWGGGARDPATFEVEHGNIRAALGHVMEQRDRDRAVRLARALRWFWVWYHTAEGWHWLEALRRAFPDDIDVLTVAAQLAWYSGLQVECHEIIERARELAEEIGQPVPLHLIAIEAARAVFDDDAERATALVDQVLARLPDVADPVEAVDLHGWCGSTLMFAGQGQRAIDIATTAVSEARSLGLPQMVTALDLVVGGGLLACRRADEAEPILWRCRADAENLGLTWVTATTSMFLARSRFQQGDTSGALERLEEATTATFAVGDMRAYAGCHDMLALAADRLGASQLAAELVGAGDRVRRSFGVRGAHVEVASRERTLTNLRSSLGAADVDEMVARGQMRDVVTAGPAWTLEVIGSLRART